MEFSVKCVAKTGVLFNARTHSVFFLATQSWLILARPCEKKKTRLEYLAACIKHIHKKITSKLYGAHKNTYMHSLIKYSLNEPL